MAMKERYYTVDGQMIGYKDAAGRKDFLTDALGSVTAEVDQTGATKTFDGRYKPYGGDLTSTGTRGSYGWVGTWGYRGTGLSASSHYVRARHYSKTSGNWSTKDPLWPNQAAFLYGLSRPTYYADPTGLIIPIIIGGAIVFSATETLMIIVGGAIGVGGISRAIYCQLHPTECPSIIWPKFPSNPTLEPDVKIFPRCDPRPWDIRGRPWDSPWEIPRAVPRDIRARPRPSDRSGPCTDWSTQQCFAGCATNAAQHRDNLGIGLIGPGVITGDIKGYMGCCISYCQAMQNFCINPLNPMPGWYCDGLLPTKVGAPL